MALWSYGDVHAKIWKSNKVLEKSDDFKTRLMLKYGILRKEYVFFFKSHRILNKFRGRHKTVNQINHINYKHIRILRKK